ncbi:MAG: hypothetical protein QW763_05855, partial [Archaeoglobaceae archaeon]
MVLIIQVLVLILIFSDFENLIEDFRIPLVRQILVFIYLTFIPGMLFLRILRIHNLDLATTLCYSVGLSLAVIMFSGLFANFFYPTFGIKPITVETLTLTFASLTILLSLFAYIRDRDFGEGKFIEIKASSSLFFLLLLPFLAIFGTYLVNHFNNTLLLLFSIPMIALIPFFVIGCYIREEYYPLAIFSSSLFL